MPKRQNQVCENATSPTKTTAGPHMYVMYPTLAELYISILQYLPIFTNPIVNQ